MTPKPRPTDELTEDPEPLVLIPYERKYWQIAVMFLPLAALIVYLVFLLAGRLLAPEWMESAGLWPSSVGDLFVRLHLPVWMIWMVGPPLWLGLTHFAEFAIWNDGLTLAVSRVGPKRLISRRRELGFYSWNEVNSCSWSHFQPGTLIVHLKQTVIQARPDFLGLDWHASGTTAPPMYFFYRVPERFRRAVEKAIRTCGEWAD